MKINLSHQKLYYMKSSILINFRKFDLSLKTDEEAGYHSLLFVKNRKTES